MMYHYLHASILTFCSILMLKTNVYHRNLQWTIKQQLQIELPEKKSQLSCVFYPALYPLRAISKSDCQKHAFRAIRQRILAHNRSSQRN